MLVGDLLSYGVDVDGVLSLVEEALASRDAVLLRGNHDRWYEDISVGKGDTEGWPDWIHESVAFAAGRLDSARFRHLPWRDEYVTKTIFFAHANPFGLGDWESYLNSLNVTPQRLMSWRQRGCAMGVFGHTHRARCYDHGPGLPIDTAAERPRRRTGRIAPQPSGAQCRRYRTTAR